jgi:hypothetical protein
MIKSSSVLVAAGLLFSAARARADEGPGAFSSWDQLDTRPLVTPQGKFEVHLGVPVFALHSTDMMGNSTTDTFEAMSIGATFGLIDNLQVGADYAFDLHPKGDISTGIFAGHAAFQALRGGNLEVAFAASIATNIGGMTTDYELQLGLWARYHLAPKVALFTGQPPVPLTLGGVSNLLSPPVAYQGQIGLNNNQPSVIAAPIGLSLQATPQLFLFAETLLATYVHPGTGSGSTEQYIGSDMLPIGVGAWLSPNRQLDLGVTFADDLKNASDFYVITVAGRLYL